MKMIQVVMEGGGKVGEEGLGKFIVNVFYFKKFFINYL